MFGEYFLIKIQEIVSEYIKNCKLKINNKEYEIDLSVIDNKITNINDVDIEITEPTDVDNIYIVDENNNELFQISVDNFEPPVGSTITIDAYDLEVEISIPNLIEQEEC